MLCLLAGCSAAADPTPPPPDGRLFTRLPSSYTGIRFENRLTDTRELNVFTYRNYYNGGGTAIGDLTGDGLPEIVLTSNLGGTRLYLNPSSSRPPPTAWRTRATRRRRCSSTTTATATSTCS